MFKLNISLCLFGTENILKLIALKFSFFVCFQSVKLTIVKHASVATFAQNVRRACIHTVADVMSAALQASTPPITPWIVTVSERLYLLCKTYKQHCHFILLGWKMWRANFRISSLAIVWDNIDTLISFLVPQVFSVERLQMPNFFSL